MLEVKIFILKEIGFHKINGILVLFFQVNLFDFRFCFAKLISDSFLDSIREYSIVLKIM
jgi:hypothetical protein